MSDYTRMWSDPGLQLPGRDAPLSVLGGSYEGMKYFDRIIRIETFPGRRRQE